LGARVGISARNIVYGKRKNPWLASSSGDNNTKKVNIRCWETTLKFTQKHHPGPLRNAARKFLR
jgi:hypothetical protein